MKNFLEDLKKELLKRKFKPEEIEEILEDHREMIETAKSEGLTDEELESKFGDPEKLAEDLKENTAETTVSVQEGGSKVEGYELFKSFQVVEKEFNIRFKLVSDDITYELHDEDTIEVYYKDVDDITEYECTFDGKEFLLKSDSKFKLRFRRKSAEFLVRIPVGVVNEEFVVQNVSGDYELEGITTKLLQLKTTSGDVSINNFKAIRGEFTTVSGDFEFETGTAEELVISMVSGDTEFENVNCAGSVSVNTVSGDLEAKNCHFGPLQYKTVSGDLDGTDFYPKSISLRSVSGDVNITNSDKSVTIDIDKKKTVSGEVNIR